MFVLRASALISPPVGRHRSRQHNRAWFGIHLPWMSISRSLPCRGASLSFRGSIYMPRPCAPPAPIAGGGSVLAAPEKKMLRFWRTHRSSTLSNGSSVSKTAKQILENYLKKSPVRYCFCLLSSSFLLCVFSWPRSWRWTCTWTATAARSVWGRPCPGSKARTAITALPHHPAETKQPSDSNGVCNTPGVNLL